ALARTGDELLAALGAGLALVAIGGALVVARRRS
ncbi:LPXTG-domain-containing protein cell wall anchor domain, partial [Corynebacterium otitidis ATCC 51513]